MVSPNKSELPFRSIWPAVLRQATYGTIKFGTYYTLKKVATEKGWLVDKAGNENVWCNAGCATVAGAVSSAIANPTDVLKVRMQVHGKGTNNAGLARCFKEIYVHEGVRGLWRVSFDDFCDVHRRSKVVRCGGVQSVSIERSLESKCSR